MIKYLIVIAVNRKKILISTLVFHHSIHTAQFTKVHFHPVYCLLLSVMRNICLVNESKYEDYSEKKP